MNSFDYATERLTRPWTDVVAAGGGRYHPIEHDPLLDMLATAIASSLGRTSSGRSDDASRNVIDPTAYALWQHIDHRTRVTLRQLGQRHDGDLKTAVTHLHDSTLALWHAGSLPESKLTGITFMVTRWAASIWELFDPPVQKEITAPCPACGERDVINQDGERCAALIAAYNRGVRPYAQCRACHKTWDGERALLELGYSIEAVMDHATLHDMGVMR